MSIKLLWCIYHAILKDVERYEVQEPFTEIIYILYASRTHAYISIEVVADNSAAI